MDLLGPDRTSALVDCRNGYVMLPKISPHLFQCRKMPSGHLAVNATTPKRWQSVDWSVPSFHEIGGALALKDKPSLAEGPAEAGTEGPGEALASLAGE